MASQYVMVPVFPETKQRLRQHGRMGQTFDALLNQILDAYEAGEEKG